MTNTQKKKQKRKKNSLKKQKQSPMLFIQSQYRHCTVADTLLRAKLTYNATLHKNKSHIVLTKSYVGEWKHQIHTWAQWLARRTATPRSGVRFLARTLLFEQPYHRASLFRCWTGYYYTLYFAI